MKIVMSSSVSLCGIRPEILAARPVVLNALERLQCGHCVISSVRDGAHSRGSLHYAGQAEDYDPLGWGPAEIERAAVEIRDALSAEFDVVAHETHIHVEWQPKSNTRA